MAKIPHMEFGNRPSAAVGVISGGSAAGDITSNLAGLAEVGYRRAAADEEARRKIEAAEEAKRQEALAAKQKIVDTITAGRMGNDFESRSRAVIETLQEKYADEPEKAEKAYVEEMRYVEDDLYRSAPNPAVEQHLAIEAQNIMGNGRKAVSDWAIARTTQKSKSDVDGLIQESAAKAEGVVDYRGLKTFMDVGWNRLSARAEMAFGGQASEKKRKFQEDSVAAWIDYNVKQNPNAVMSALDSGVLDEFIPTKERGATRAAAQRGFEDLAVTQEYNLLRDAAEHNNKYVNMYLSGELNASDIRNERKRLEVQRSSIAADPKFVVGGKLTTAGQNQIKIVENQMKTIDALNNFYGRSRDKGVDNDDTVSFLLRAQNDIFGENAGDNRTDLQLWSEQRDRLFKAYGDRLISKGTFDTMYKELSLGYPAAAEADVKATGGILASWGWKARTARQAGVAALQEQITTKGKAFSTNDVGNAHLWYSQFITEALQTGSVTEEKARELALKAFSVVANNKTIEAGNKAIEGSK